jgi:hypothetical protein
VTAGKDRHFQEKIMAEEKKKPARKHLHQIRSEETEDGHIVHHHTYKAKRGDEKTEPERKNVAVSASPEEAGEHTAEQFGMNAPPQAGADPGAGDPSAGGGDPNGGAPQETMG